MFSTQYLFRLVKTTLVSSIGIMAVLIVIGNTTDYYTNYYFVVHVMKMDTIFPNSQVHYRAVNQPYLFHTGYILLIVLEAFMAFSCIKASFQMFQSIRKSAVQFHQSKKWGVAGIGIGLVIWFLGFEVIGGEWFAMWQSSSWNGLGAAERISTFLGIVLILLHLNERELDA